MKAAGAPQAQSCTKLPEVSPERPEPRINVKEPLHPCEVTPKS